MNDEQRSLRLEQVRRDLEDNLLGMAQLEKRQSELIRQTAQRQTSVEADPEAQRKRYAEFDAMIERLVSGIGEFLPRTISPKVKLE